jgi:hypothetical protein
VPSELPPPPADPSLPDVLLLLPQAARLSAPVRMSPATPATAEKVLRELMHTSVLESFQ